MTTWKDPPEYLTQLAEYLAPIRDTAQFDGLYWSATDVEHFRAYLEVVELFRPMEGAIVLDLGMGTGGLLIGSWQRGASRLIGVEVDETVAAMASTRLGPIGAEVHLTDGGSIPLPDASVDIVVSVHALEHADSLEDFIVEIARVLRPGGGDSPSRLP